MEALPKVACLFRGKDRCWTLRRRVPDEIRSVIGKREIWVSYGPVSHTEAHRRHALEMAKLDAIFAEARRRLKLGLSSRTVLAEPAGPIRSRSLPPPVPHDETLEEPTEDTVRKAVLRWFHADERKSEAGDREVMMSADESSVEEVLDLIRVEEAHLSGVDGKRLAQRNVDALMRGFGFGVPKGEVRRLAIAMLQAAYLEGAQRSIQRLRGHSGLVGVNPLFRRVLPLDEAPPAPTPALAANKLPAIVPVQPLLEAFDKDRRPAASTKAKRLRAWGSLRAIVKHDDVARITKADVRALIEARRDAGAVNKTIADDIGLLSALFQWAITQGHLEGENPFARMSPSHRGQTEGRVAFTDDDARTILCASRDRTDYLRWLPWLLAFTGCRLAEAAGAMAEDIRKVDGVWCLDIRERATRRLKTEVSARRTPLHPALIEEGFLAYVHSRPAESHLFDGIPPSGAGSLHGRWVRELGINDPLKAPAHAWRHRMREQLTRVGVTEEVKNAIGGWTHHGGAGARYGKSVALMPAVLLESLKRVPSPAPPNQ